MHALSVKQPYAEWIASGEKKIEYRTWRAPRIVGKDLLIVASKSPGEGYDGEALGVAICVVRVAGMRGGDGDWEWDLTNPRRVDPVAVRGFAALYTVADDQVVYRKSPRLTPTAGARAARQVGPYTFSIGDRGIRGERAKTPAAARKRARELAGEHGTTITISRDGIAVSGEG